MKHYSVHIYRIFHQSDMDESPFLPNKWLLSTALNSWYGIMAEAWDDRCFLGVLSLSDLLHNPRQGQLQRSTSLPKEVLTRSPCITMCTWFSSIFRQDLLCDDVLPDGWYRFLTYGMSRDMATSCPGKFFQYFDDFFSQNFTSRIFWYAPPSHYVSK